MTNKKVELLAPVGNFEKLEVAIHYGADAVYLGGKNFSLRNFSENFTLEEMKEGIKLSHKNNIHVYVTCNTYPRNIEIQEIEDYFKSIYEMRPDAIIVSDTGIFSLAREIMPNIPIHLSTQANTTNYKSVLFWEKLGVKRINIARELSLKEIREIKDKCNIEIEAFIHGALCISYSGRCLLSSFMANRESNRGMCCQPCRWNYAVVEEKRPGEYFKIAEDENGTYIFNSKDLCMIEYIPEMIESGIDAFKIEGRAKTTNYLATTLNVYRQAIDLYYQNPSNYKMKKEWIDELNYINSRGYCTGFYIGDKKELIPNFEKRTNYSENTFLGKVVEKIDDKRIKLDVRNKLFKGDIIEIISPNIPNKKDVICQIFNEYDVEVPFAQPNTLAIISLTEDSYPYDLIRRVIS
ncbi:MAG: U32 family peptidase [Desulfobacterales bacterium]|nr:U32 family peptidase [Desulfobacterales bacterium]